MFVVYACHVLHNLPFNTVRYVFFDDNSFSRYKMGTHDVGKLWFSIYSLYRMGTYDVVHGCHPAGEYRYKIWLMASTPLKNISHLGLLFPIYGNS